MNSAAAESAPFITSLSTPSSLSHGGIKLKSELRLGGHNGIPSPVHLLPILLQHRLSDQPCLMNLKNKSYPNPLLLLSLPQHCIMRGIIDTVLFKEPLTWFRNIKRIGGLITQCCCWMHDMIPPAVFVHLNTRLG